jgi:hypothetical protein
VAGILSSCLAAALLALSLLAAAMRDTCSASQQAMKSKQQARVPSYPLIASKLNSRQPPQAEHIKHTGFYAHCVTQLLEATCLAQDGSPKAMSLSTLPNTKTTNSTQLCGAQQPYCHHQAVQ